MNKLKITAAFLLMLASSRAYTRTDSRSIGIVLSPKVCMTSNYTGFLGILPNKAGIGYDILVNYAFRPKNVGLAVEFGLGMASFRQSVNPEPLEVFLAKDALSYNFNYLQAVLKVGYAFQWTRPKLTVIPLAAFRYMYYLPSTVTNTLEWNYADNENFSSDLRFARWQATPNAYPFSAYMMNLSVKLEKAVTRNIIVCLAPFLDFGLRTLQTSTFRSEFDYIRNEDYGKTLLTTNKGDAFGVSLGVAYKL